MHDLLTDTLPTEWEGRAIDPDFRPMVWLLIRTRRVKTNEDSARLIASAIPLFFVEPIPVAQYPEAFESRVRFCQGGGPEYEERTGTGSSSDPQDEPVLDYRCDADYIVGAFQQAYGIDLTADKVHWWRFKALLHALPPETPLGKIVEIRGKDTSGMDRADRDYYETLKERFVLPDGLKGVKRNETLQEHEDAFLNRFG